MLNQRAYVPDKFKPLVPQPPPIHKNASIDRELMLEYARKRYYAQLTVEIDD